ncbi:hypothetical protein [Synechococcus sp. PCC 7336]|uniref:hypothetical protein n=1 Tax=Synechococcus sp. PCC 7336 TaxID=195250 RepID=UPI00034A3BD6|nr:hypothetical protein [Synechococcus sp. PCC 7336]
MIHIVLETDTFEVGGEIAGQVSVSLDRNNPPKQIEIEALWRTEGRGTRDKRTIDSVSPPLEGATWAIGRQFPFRFPLPDDVPISYDGELIRVIWEVEVRVALGWLKSLKETASFRVLPKNSRR